MIELDEFERERFQIWCRDVVVRLGWYCVQESIETAGRKSRLSMV